MENAYDLFQGTAITLVDALISVLSSGKRDIFQDRIALTIIFLIVMVVLSQLGRIFFEQFQLIKALLSRRKLPIKKEARESRESGLRKDIIHSAIVN